jgi:hypothetical protein
VSLFFGMAGDLGDGSGGVPHTPPPPPATGGTYEVGGASLWLNSANLSARFDESVDDFNFTMVRLAVPSDNQFINGPGASAAAYAAAIADANSKGLTVRLQLGPGWLNFSTWNTGQATAGGTAWGTWFEENNLTVEEIGVFNETNNLALTLENQEGLGQEGIDLAVDLAVAWAEAFEAATPGGRPSMSALSFGHKEIRQGGVWAEAILDALLPHHTSGLFDSHSFHFYCDKNNFSLSGGLPVLTGPRSPQEVQAALYTSAGTPLTIKTRIDECNLPINNTWANDAERAAYLPYFANHLAGMQEIGSVMFFGPWHSLGEGGDEFTFRPETVFGDAVAAWCLANG